MASLRSRNNDINNILLVVSKALEKAKQEGQLLPEALEALKHGVTVVDEGSAFEKKLKYHDCRDDTKKMLDKMDPAGREGVADKLFGLLGKRRDMFPKINGMFSGGGSIDTAQVERMLESYHWFIAIQLDNEIAGWAAAETTKTA